MKDEKKSSYFNRVEDKYVFRISTAFWHLLIGAITVTAIIGIVLFIYSLIPSSKNEIKASEYPTKASYPPVEKVSLSDLNIKDEKIITPVVQAPPPVYQPSIDAEYDSDKPAYDLSLSELKRIIPQDQWQPGSWFYPAGELAWEAHQTDQYRKWNPSGENVEQRLERSYKQIKAKKYSGKKIALDAYLKVLKQIPPSNSNEVLNTIIYSMNDRFTDLHLLDSTFSLIAKSIETFSNSKDAAQHLIGFALNNPKATFKFIPFAVQVCKELSDSSRFQVLTVLSNSFYSSFNENVEVQKEATEQFNNLRPLIRGVDTDIALRKFYSVYNQKNRKRNEEITRIDDDYNAQIASILADSTMKAIQADIEFAASKELKSDLRKNSIYAIAGGFIAIALLGTILTLLSIQRILKKLEVVSFNKD